MFVFVSLYSAMNSGCTQTLQRGCVYHTKFRKMLVANTSINTNVVPLYHGDR